MSRLRIRQQGEAFSLLHLAAYWVFQGLAKILSEDFALSPANANENDPAQIYDLSPKATHHAPKAKNIIQLFMNGGPSQVDSFYPKPVLNRMDGKPYPGNVEEIGIKAHQILA